MALNKGEAVDKEDLAAEMTAGAIVVRMNPQTFFQNPSHIFNLYKNLLVSKLQVAMETTREVGTTLTHGIIVKGDGEVARAAAAVVVTAEVATRGEAGVTKTLAVMANKATAVAPQGINNIATTVLRHTT